jgi:hypothetical protein
VCYAFAVESSERQLKITRTTALRTVRATWWLLALYSASLLASTSFIAAHRHLWFDEIDTSFIAALPNLNAIWNALLLAADGQPVGFYVPVHLASLLFGPSEVSLRLCAIVPFWLTTLVLYYSVARRTSALYGFVAALMPSCTVGYLYSFEARPYALVLLFSACSFAAWQFAKEGRRRFLSVPGIALALGAAISVHYNAVLIALPILIGELVYTIRKRNIDWGVVIAIFASGLPILFSLPHIRAIHVYSKNYWSHTSFGALAELYFLLSPQLVVLAILGCTAFVICAFPFRKGLGDIKVEVGVLPCYELAAAAGYLLLPVACFVLSFYTKALHYRYVIATIIGFSVLIPFAFWICRSVIGPAARILCALLVVNLLYVTYLRIHKPDEAGWGTFAQYSELFSPTTTPIYDSTQALVCDGGSFLVIAKYGSDNLRERSFYLLDKLQVTNSVLVFRGLQKAVRGPFHLAELDSFMQTHSSFLLYNPEAWLLDQLLAGGNTVTVRANLAHGLLYEVVIRH